MQHVEENEAYPNFSCFSEKLQGEDSSKKISNTYVPAF